MAVSKFVAPRLETVSKRQVEIPFQSAIAAGAHLTLMTGIIPYPFRILQVKMAFPEEADNLVVHRWLISRTRTAPTTGPPPDRNIFGRESPRARFSGKAIVRIANTNIEVNRTDTRIKLYTHNGTPYAYTINGSIIIQEL